MNKMKVSVIYAKLITISRFFFFFTHTTMSKLSEVLSVTFNLFMNRMIYNTLILGFLEFFLRQILVIWEKEISIKEIL